MDTAPPAETCADIELFVHRAGAEDPQLVRISATATVRQLIEHHEASPGEDSIWVEERDDPLDLDARLEHVGLGHRRHAHLGRCRTLTVVVRFNGTTKTREFLAVATKGRVFAWATGPQGFALSAAQRPKHALAVRGADHFLDPDVHVGSLAGPRGSRSGGGDELACPRRPRSHWQASTRHRPGV